MKKLSVLILFMAWFNVSGISTSSFGENNDHRMSALPAGRSEAPLNGGGKNENDGKGKDKDNKGKGGDSKGSCGNSSHDHSKDKDGGKSCDGKDKEDKDDKGKEDKDDKVEGGGNTGGGSGPKPTCDGNSFSSEIVSKNVVSETCVEYEIKVSYDGTRTFGLSHFTMAIPCGQVSNISNTENWKQVFGKDPTTGVYGLKIDNIEGFGENGADHFIIKFTWCADDSCNNTLGVVSYKAGQCIDYDTLQDNSNDGGDTGGGNGSGDDGDTGGDDSDGDTGDDGDGDNDDDDSGGGTPPDSTSTCSTLIVKLQKTNVSCAGFSNGQLNTLILDGQEPYTFAWSTGATSASIQNLSTGNYMVTVKDAKGNTITLAETITAPQAISIAESITQPTCTGLTNGAITLNVTGGSGVYTFAWSNGSTQQNLSNLGSGSYTVAVTDSSGCATQKTFTLINSAPISVGVSFTHPTCAQSNGTIDITPSGGVAPYTYLWSTGATTQDLQNGGPGTYTVKIIDASGCSVNMVYALRVINTTILKYVVTPTSCADDGSGAIDLTVTGGTAPYTYLWQDGVTTEDRSGLKSGLYKVTVTEAGGCTSTININVFKKTFTVSSEVKQPVCAGDLGAVTLTPVDGVSPYTYNWSNGDTDNSISGLSGGTYSVTITDASGCSVTMVFVMPTLLAITSTSAVSNAQCGAEGAYSIDLTVGGGVAPYKYVWSNGATTQDVSGVNSGMYAVNITDAYGCSATLEVAVNPVSVSWNCLINQPTTEAVCNSAGNLISTSVSEAATYQWVLTSTDNSWAITAGSNASTAVYSVGNAGTTATFTLTITKDGCTKTCTYTTSATGCVEKDNTGGGDPTTGDPCAGDSTTTTTKIIATDTTMVTSNTQQTEEKEEQETTEIASLEESNVSGYKVSAYPNPFTDRVNFEWTAQEDDFVRVEILDLLGRSTSVPFSGPVQKGNSYQCDWMPSGTDRIYIYKFHSSKKVEQGKLLLK